MAVEGGSDSCVSGLACVLAGVCLVYCPPIEEKEERKCDVTTLLDVLSNRVGLATYFSRWEVKPSLLRNGQCAVLCLVLNWGESGQMAQQPTAGLSQSLRDRNLD